MKAVLLIDFGSTNTKVAAVCVEEQRLLGTAAAYTTVDTDVREGLNNALAELYIKTGELSFKKKLACSSAAGGLKMIASGLVPELTAKAARAACLGAGAKLVKTYSYQLIDEDIDEIATLKPDIFLLAGGTDGGDRKNIINNAQMLAECEIEFPVLIAGNRAAAAECEKILSGRETYRCENVLPVLSKLNVEPAQKRIREIFLRKITKAKGLSDDSTMFDSVLMPTPAAMLKAMELLSKGIDNNGLGELLAVDLGGATTDVYSISRGLPIRDNVIYKGLEEPYAKRTVEGDIGMRYSAKGVLEAAGAERLSDLSGLSKETVIEMIARLTENLDTIPKTAQEEKLDYALACAAFETAVRRHAGTMEEVYTPQGLVYAQTGKDLTQIEKLVVTGGAVIHNPKAAEIASFALNNHGKPGMLCPKQVSVYVDKQYILAAAGLLADEYPEAALAIMIKELEDHGNYKQKTQ